MGFNEKCNELGYSVRDWNEKKVSIQKSLEKSKIIIIFDINCKKILGYVQQTDLIMDIGDMSNIYKAFNIMKSDLKVFAEMSEYDIIK